MSSVYSYPLSQRASQRTGDLQALREESAKRPTTPPTPLETIQRNRESLIALWGHSPDTEPKE